MLSPALCTARPSPMRGILDFLPHRGNLCGQEASLEDRKEFVRAFVSGVSVAPGDALLEVPTRTLPAVGVLRPPNFTCGLVAGARYEPLQIDLRPLDRFLAGLRRAA